MEGLAFIPSLLPSILSLIPVKENKNRVASCSLPKLWCYKMKNKHTPLSVKWFGHEPFQNGDRIYGDYMFVCKICYNHDIVEELKNNNYYYVSHAITFHIVLSKERWTFCYLLTSLNIAEYECHIKCLTIETSRRMHLAGHGIITLMRTEFIVVFCGVRVSEFKV